MALSKSQLNFIVDLMGAWPMDGSEPTHHHAVTYCPNDQVYYGEWDKTLLNRLVSLGVIILVGEEDEDKEGGIKMLRLRERDDFLSSFESGVKEAKNNNGLDYADYVSNQYAFTAGHQQWHQCNGKRKVTYSLKDEDVCHGFPCEDTQDIYHQG